jgi:magnesium transporter
MSAEFNWHIKYYVNLIGILKCCGSYFLFLLAIGLQVREYIDDTEDYVNIQLDNHRNELIQLQLTLTIASFAIAIETLIAGAFGMNIPCSLYKTDGIFWHAVGIMTAVSIVIFVLVLAYAKWKKLLGS